MGSITRIRLSEAATGDVRHTPAAAFLVSGTTADIGNVSSLSTAVLVGQHNSIDPSLRLIESITYAEETGAAGARLPTVWTPVGRALARTENQDPMEYR
ncbi:hypothetical protein AB0L57_08010 [Nocardia sp. NPDC052254]|uniref:hypothetical protein n=1 Tax=Nocardia sp. NPDC052254 TaxID=3155681 RepID=UPI003427D90F